MTESTGFTPERSDAIRAVLVDVVDERPVRGGRRIGVGIGLVLAGMLVGGGAVTAAAAILDVNPHPRANGVTVTGEVQPVPEGVIPGQPVVTMLGGTVVVVIDGQDLALVLDPVTDATHVRVTITCTSAGTTSWGLDVGGNNPSIECTDADLLRDATSRSAWMDFSLAEGETVYVNPQRGGTSVITLQYVSRIETGWDTNENGESFGVSQSGQGDPDLVYAQGHDGADNVVMGYVRSDDLGQQCPGAAEPSSPEQALEQQERCQRDYPHGFDVPLYESDGVTQIGTFHVGG